MLFNKTLRKDQHRAEVVPGYYAANYAACKKGETAAKTGCEPKEGDGQKEEAPSIGKEAVKAATPTIPSRVNPDALTAEESKFLDSFRGQIESEGVDGTTDDINEKTQVVIDLVKESEPQVAEALQSWEADTSSDPGGFAPRGFNGIVDAVQDSRMGDVLGNTVLTFLNAVRDDLLDAGVKEKFLKQP